MTAPTISASAIESFDPALGGCARKWAFSRLDGVPKPQSPGAALGSRCHELWESYLRDGTPFDLSTPEGRICDATRHLLPLPGACLSIEEAFRFTWEGVTWAGKKDAVYMVEPDIVVLDHKTTSDFRYAKTTREALLEHPQAPLYAVAEAQGTWQRVFLAWNHVKHNVTFDKDAPPNERGYTIKRAGRPVALEPPVRLVVSRTEAEDALGKHVPTAKRMLAIIAAPPAPHECVLTGDKYIAKQLEPNPDACDAFGGCPYRSQCGLTPQDIAARMTRLFAAPQGAGEQKNMSSALRDRIAQIKADRAGNGPAQSTAIGVQQAIEAEAAARAAQNAATMQTPASVAAHALVAAQNAAAQVKAYEARAVDAEALRQAAPGNEGRVVFGPVNPPEGSHAVVGDVEPLAENFTASGQAQPLPPAEAPTQPDAPAPKRRGRPPGSKNKVKGAAEPETTVLAQAETYVPSAEECAAVEEACVSDTVPAPADDDLPFDDEKLSALAYLLVKNILKALEERR